MSALPPPRRIAVFRALQLGDLLCSVPALRALRAACPQARITLVGLPGAADFARRFGHYIDELLPFPGMEMFPEQSPRPDELPAFFEAARERRFDLALQLHGSGLHANGVVRRLGARRWAGFVPHPAQARAGWRLAWPQDLPEPLRYTALIEHMGMPVESVELELPLFPGEDGSARRLLAGHGLQPNRTVVLHAGARLPSRRWPVRHYAAVANALARGGWQVALTGAPDEAGLVSELAGLCRYPAANLCGQTTLGELAALLSRCRLLISNDTGVSHVAAAAGAASVVVACGSDARRWAPLDRQRHKVLAAGLPCRPCMHAVCPIGHPCALAVTPAEVLARAHDVLRGGRHAR